MVQAKSWLPSVVAISRRHAGIASIQTARAHSLASAYNGSSKPGKGEACLEPGHQCLAFEHTVDLARPTFYDNDLAFERPQCSDHAKFVLVAHSFLIQSFSPADLIRVGAGRKLGERLSV